jgi:c-di-GMP-related signal transduction protein
MAAQPDTDALLPLIRFRLALLIIGALNLGQEVLIPTAMASSLLRIIAEGIETEQQHNFLREEGCQKGQGYLFSKPLPAHKVSALLRRNRGSIIQHQFPRFRALEPSKHTAAGPS